MRLNSAARLQQRMERKLYDHHYINMIWIDALFQSHFYKILDSVEYSFFLIIELMKSFPFPIPEKVPIPAKFPIPVTFALPRLQSCSPGMKQQCLMVRNFSFSFSFSLSNFSLSNWSFGFSLSFSFIIPPVVKHGGLLAQNNKSRSPLNSNSGQISKVSVVLENKIQLGRTLSNCPSLCNMHSGAKLLLKSSSTIFRGSRNVELSLCGFTPKNKVK